MHVPLSKDAVREATPTLVDVLKQEESATDQSVLGHFIFICIPPYVDGNGRIGCFVMNFTLTSGGDLWIATYVNSSPETKL